MAGYVFFFILPIACMIMSGLTVGIIGYKDPMVSGIIFLLFTGVYNVSIVYMMETIYNKLKKEDKIE